MTTAERRISLVDFAKAATSIIGRLKVQRDACVTESAGRAVAATPPTPNTPLVETVSAKLKYFRRVATTPQNFCRRDTSRQT